MIDPSRLDWPHLLSGWAWLLPRDEFTVWLMNRFGDLFLVFSDGALHMLDIGCGRLDRIARDREEFCQIIDETDHANNWFMIPLVNRLEEAGVTLKPGYCYGFLTPPILGGAYSVENTRVVPIEELYGIYGSYHEALKDLPDGAKVSIKVIDD